MVGKALPSEIQPACSASLSVEPSEIVEDNRTSEAPVEPSATVSLHIAASELIQLNML